MILVGVAILMVLAGFLVSIIVTVLELLAVLVATLLVLEGIAMLLFGTRVWRRRWEWGPPTDT